MRNALILLISVLATGCGGDSITSNPPVMDAGVPPASVFCTPDVTEAYCAYGDEFACELRRILAEDGTDAALSPLVGGPATNRDTILRSLFPAIGDKTIVDGDVVVPEGLVFDHASFDPYEIPVPVNWAADPYGNSSWRFDFQSFHWFFEYYQGQPPAVHDGAALLVDWVDQVLRAEPAPDYTWGDHALAKRLGRTVQLIDAYIAHAEPLNRRVLEAGAMVLVTHLYALASDACYATKHNHGLMGDLAVLRAAGQFSALVDAELLWQRAETRLHEQQIRLAVTEDYLGIENTPSYHLLYIELLNEAISVFVDAGASADELTAVRDGMIEPLIHMLQPDLSFSQFGDCYDISRSKKLRAVHGRAIELGVGSIEALGQLEWAASAGTAGAPPSALDRVYEKGGYAFFRDRWNLDGDVATGHFKCTRLSTTHYNADETSFELFAHGTELIVGPGSYTNNRDDPFRIYQRSPAAQNVLVVDGDDTVPGQPTTTSRILAHGGEGSSTPWVQGTHENFAHLGIESHVRTFAFVKPDTWVIVDHVSAAGRHDYDQHFHLHPDLDSLTYPNPQTVIAQSTVGPSLALVAGSVPEGIEAPRGVAEGDVRRGWWFPDHQVAVPNHDVVLSYRDDRSAIDLPVVIVVTEPGAPARIPTGVTYTEQDGHAIVSWVLDDTPHSLEIPAR